MNLVLDERIDYNLKLLLEATLKLLDIEDFKNMNLTKNLIENIVPFLCENYSLSFKKIQNLLHIILYNYNYAQLVDDYVYEEINFKALVENLSVDALLKILADDDNIMYYLIEKYYEIIFNEGLWEMLKTNEEVYDEIPWINDWYLTIPREYELVTTKLCNLLFTIKNYCDYLKTPFKDEILLKLLYEDKDIFNVVPEFFNSIAEFKTYKPLLMQMLYLDSYYYLQCEKRKGNTDSIDFGLILFLEEKIKNNKISSIPQGELTTLKLLDYFYLVNEDKNYFKILNPEELVKMQEIIKKKASKVLLLEYCQSNFFLIKSVPRFGSSNRIS